MARKKGELHLELRATVKVLANAGKNLDEIVELILPMMTTSTSKRDHRRSAKTMYGAHVAKTRETSSDSSTLRTLTHCRPIFERLPNFDQIPFVSQVELIAMPDVVDAEVAEASATILELGRTRRATHAKAAGSTKSRSAESCHARQASL